MRTIEKAIAVTLLMLWLAGFLVAGQIGGNAPDIWGAAPMLAFAAIMGALHALGWVLRGWIWLDRRLRR